MSIQSEAEGKADASLGAWAGTGAFAGGEVKVAGAFGGSFKLEAGGGVEFCAPLGGGAPPVRAASAGPTRSPELDQLRTTLTGLTSQFNLTPATLGQSLTGISTAIASPGSINLQSVGGYLPLPPALSSIAANPVGASEARAERRDHRVRAGQHGRAAAPDHPELGRHDHRHDLPGLPGLQPTPLPELHDSGLSVTLRHRRLQPLLEELPAQ